MRVSGDGVELNVEVAGDPDAPLVVFLHGVSGSVETYGWLPPSVTDGRRVVRVDLRGHGLSDRAPGTYEVGAYSADVIAVLRALGGGTPATLVGHSLGGVVAWTVAQRAPELVDALFLEDPPLYMAEPDEHDRNAAIPVFRALRAASLSWKASGVEVAGAAQLLGESPMAATAADGAMTARAHAMLTMDPGVLDAAIDRSALAATDLAAPIHCPTVLLAGDEEYAPAFNSAHQERLARTHPDVEVIRLSEVGHLIHDDRVARDEYVERLAAFLDRDG